MKSTNYFNTLILVAVDCPAHKGLTPPNRESVGGIQFSLLQDHPYQFTSDDLLHQVHCLRLGGQALAREDFFSKPQACLRTSPLAKRWGWGIHFDAQGKIGLVSAASLEYEALRNGGQVQVVPAMRNRRH